MIRLFMFVISYQTVLQSGCTILHCPQNQSSLCSTSSSAVGIVSFLDVDYSNRCIVVSHCCLNLLFPNSKRYLASFYMLSAICLSSLVQYMLDLIWFANLVLRILHWYSGDILVLTLLFCNVFLPGLDIREYWLHN